MFALGIVSSKAAGFSGELQDLSTYTKTDPSSDLTVTSTKVTATTMASVVAHLRKDFGAGYFAGNFTVRYEIQKTDSAAGEYFDAIIFSDNAPPCSTDIYNAHANAILVEVPGSATSNTYLFAYDGASPYYQISAGADLASATTYYCTLVRDESVGTYGTIYNYIYSDAARTTLAFSVQSVTLRSPKVDYRYFSAIASDHSGGAGSVTGFVQNIYIQNS